MTAEHRRLDALVAAFVVASWPLPADPADATSADASGDKRVEPRWSEAEAVQQRLNSRAAELNAIAETPQQQLQVAELRLAVRKQAEQEIATQQQLDVQLSVAEEKERGRQLLQAARVQAEQEMDAERERASAELVAVPAAAAAAGTAAGPLKVDAAVMCTFPSPVKLDAATMCGIALAMRADAATACEPPLVADVATMCGSPLAMRTDAATMCDGTSQADAATTTATIEPTQWAETTPIKSTAQAALKPLTPAATPPSEPPTPAGTAEPESEELRRDLDQLDLADCPARTQPPRQANAFGEISVGAPAPAPVLREQNKLNNLAGPSAVETASRSPQSAGSPQGTMTVSEFASLTEAEIEELVELSSSELKELMGEFSLGVLQRKRLLRDIAAEAELRAVTGRSDDQQLGDLPAISPHEAGEDSSLFADTGNTRPAEEWAKSSTVRRNSSGVSGVTAGVTAEHNKLASASRAAEAAGGTTAVESRLGAELKLVRVSAGCGGAAAAAAVAGGGGGGGGGASAVENLASAEDFTERAESGLQRLSALLNTEW